MRISASSLIFLVLTGCVGTANFINPAVQVNTQAGPGGTYYGPESSPYVAPTTAASAQQVALATPQVQTPILTNPKTIINQSQTVVINGPVINGPVVDSEVVGGTGNKVSNSTVQPEGNVAIASPFISQYPCVNPISYPLTDQKPYEFVGDGSQDMIGPVDITESSSLVIGLSSRMNGGVVEVQLKKVDGTVVNPRILYADSFVIGVPDGAATNIQIKADSCGSPGQIEPGAYYFDVLRATGAWVLDINHPTGYARIANSPTPASPASTPSPSPASSAFPTPPASGAATP